MAKATINKTFTDPTAPWEVTIPHVGPLVDAVPLTVRFECDESDDPQETIENASILGPFGSSTWHTFDEALDFLRAAEATVLCATLRCPVCGGDARPGSTEFLVCDRCRELLRPAELVPVATDQTRRAYARANGHDPETYGLPEE